MSVVKMLGAWEEGRKMNDCKGFTVHQITGSLL